MATGNELANAVTLLGDPVFANVAKAASVYQARKVVTEPVATADHDVRLRLAQAVVENPEWMVQRALSVLATDPAVNTRGTTLAAIGQDAILASMETAWTALAKLLFPDGSIQP